MSCYIPVGCMNNASSRGTAKWKHNACFQLLFCSHFLKIKQGWQAFLSLFTTPKWQHFQFCPFHLGSLHSKLGYCWLSISNLDFLRISVSQPENITQNKVYNLRHHKGTELLERKTSFFFFFQIFFSFERSVYFIFFFSLSFIRLKMIELHKVTSITFWTSSQ